MTRILVTDGGSRAGLAVTRALGRRGHYVIAGEKSRPFLSQASRFCSHAFVYPDPHRQERQFVEHVAAVAARERADVIIPIADITTTIITEHRSLFAPGVRIPFANADAIRRAADKVDMVRTAERLGVPVPRSRFVTCLDEVRDGVEGDLPFPIVVKPHRSRVRSPDGWLSCSVGYANDPAQLLSGLRARPPAEFPMILQERVQGPGIGVFAAYRDGQVAALFSHRRIREKPPWGGVSVLCESMPVGPAIRRYAESLLDDLKWEGVAMVEFKIDLADGQPKLMEINGRFWGSLQLAIDAGVDFPNILVDASSTGGPAPYRTGVRSRWLWGDVDSLLVRLRRSGPVGWANSSRLRPIVDFLELWDRSLYYDNPKLYDMKPFLLETLQWIRR
jgi:predicted ATP-grasp superfamily ATP-dependent carboligase